MSDKPSATFTINCAGCYNEITTAYNGAYDFEYKIQQMISKEGWIRRDFGPNARLWFCSPPCAFQSNAALQCEDWWRQHRESNRYNWCLRIVLATITTIVLALLSAFIVRHLLGV